MKKSLHPKYFPTAIVTCACGANFPVGSTMEKLSVEICSACHPFFTGNEKVLDTAGRVERFKTRLARKTPAEGRSKATPTPKVKKVKTKKAPSAEN